MDTDINNDQIVQQNNEYEENTTSNINNQLDDTLVPIVQNNFDNKTTDYEKQLKLANNIDSAKSLEELKIYIKEAIDMGLANNQFLIEKANSKKNQLTSLINIPQPITENLQPANVESEEGEEKETKVNINYSAIENHEQSSDVSEEETFQTSKPTITNDDNLNSPIKVNINETTVPNQPVQTNQGIQIDHIEMDDIPTITENPSTEYIDDSTINHIDNFSHEASTNSDLKDLPTFTDTETKHLFNAPQNFLEKEVIQTNPFESEAEVIIPVNNQILAHEKELLKNFNELMGELVVLASESNILSTEDKNEAKNIAEELKNSWESICQKRGKSLNDADSIYIIEIIDQQLKKIF